MQKTESWLVGKPDNWSCFQVKFSFPILHALVTPGESLWFFQKWCEKRPFFTKFFDGIRSRRFKPGHMTYHVIGNLAPIILSHCTLIWRHPLQNESQICDFSIFPPKSRSRNTFFMKRSTFPRIENLKTRHFQYLRVYINGKKC